MDDQGTRALDEARLLGGMSKAELARHIEARLEVVRRRFTREDGCEGIGEENAVELAYERR